MVASVGTFDAHPPLAATAGVIRQVIDGRTGPAQRLKEEELVQQMEAEAAVAEGGE
jgi:hypothetical protein